jgi:hypothetical protein
MSPQEFVLQIEMFLTNTDTWETQDSFFCAFNEGFFRSLTNGNCFIWKDNYWHIGKVEKNNYNSYDLVIADPHVYRTEDMALKALEKYDPIISQ